MSQGTHCCCPFPGFFTLFSLVSGQKDAALAEHCQVFSNCPHGGCCLMPPNSCVPLLSHRSQLFWSQALVCRGYQNAMKP